MPLIPNKLKSTLKGNESKQSSVDLARQITDWYDQGVRQGRDLSYGNTVLSVNKPGYYSALAPAFVDIEAQGSPNEQQITIIENAFKTAAIAYWTGGQLALAIPPPGAVSVVSNFVTNPGTFNISLKKEDSLDGFVNKVTNAHKQHLQTVSGTTIGLVPQPSGPPVPTPFPWVGYQ